MKNWAIQIEDVSKTYRIKDVQRGKKVAFDALQHIDLNVEKGKVLGLIGANGAGKSTLLKILARITYPSTGKITINGRISSLLEVGTGFHPELTGRENIFLNGAILGMKQAEIKQQFDEIVAFSGVSKFLETPVKHYSSGMYVRLAFSVAAHLSSDILLIDEVLAVGDADFQRKCISKMEDAAQNQNKTVIFVSHNMAIANKLCEEIVLLDQGKIIKKGLAEEVTHFYYNQLKSTSNKIAIKDRTDRAGTGEAKILDIKLTSKNKENNLLHAGKPIDIQIDYNLNEALYKSDLDITLNITNEQGHYLSTLSSKLNGTLITGQKGVQSTFCHIPKLPLMPGEYYITASIKANGKRADFVSHALYFKVSDFDFYNKGEWVHPKQGGIYMDYTWNPKK